MAALAAVGMVVGGLGFSGSARAAGEVSISHADFLTGTAVAADLASLVALQGAAAANVGTPATVEQARALDVTALSAINVDLGSGVNLLGTGGLLTLGAANQYARANNDGSSSAASGAVTNTGAVSIGAGPQGPATLELTPLLAAASATTALSGAQLSASALAGTASQTIGGTQSGSYAIGGLNLDLKSPLVAGIKPSVAPVVSAAQDSLHNLATNAGVQALCPLVPPCLLTIDEPDLSATVNALTNVTVAGGAVTADLNTGAVHVDLAGLLAFHGLDLNALAPNTNLLSLVQAELSSDLLTGLQGALDKLSADLTAEINTTGVSIAGVAIDPAVLSAALGPIVAALTTGIQAVTGQLGSTVVQPIVAALALLLTISVNNQAVSAGTFTEAALRVGLVPSSALATVNLAAAAVGPNAGPPAPTAAAIAPGSGPTSGGTSITITGTNFEPGVTSVDIGGLTVGAAAVTVAPDGSSLTFAAPAHAAGPVPVTVSTVGGTTAPLTFTYLAAPVASGLTPDAGPLAGGQAVTVTGTGFVPGQTSVSLGGNVVLPGSVTVDPAGDSLTFVTPAHAAGPVALTVTTAGGSTTPLSYSYLNVPGAPSLSPSAGPITGGQTVTMTGADFVVGHTSVTIGGIVLPVGSVTVAPSGDSLTFVTPAHVAGPALVSAKTAGGTTAGLAYAYLPLPAAASLSPDAGPSAGGQTVTVIGTGFVAGLTTVNIGGTAIPVGSVTVDPSGAQLTFSTPAHAAGSVPVTVATPGGTTTALLTYLYVDPPASSALTPPSGPVTGGTVLTVDGSNFVPGQTWVSIGGLTVPAGSVSVLPGGASLTFAAPPHASGPVTATVTTPGGTTGAQAYDYLPLPNAAEISPNAGPVAGGQTVTVTGTGFVPGQSAVTIGGIAVPAAAVSVVLGGTSLTFVTPAHLAGTVDAIVTTASGTTAPLSYRYLPLPVAPVFGGPANGSRVATALPLISGSGSPQATVTVSESATQLCTTTVRPNGAWSCTPSGPLANRSHTITATQGTIAGLSTASAPVTFTVAVPTSVPPPTAAPTTAAPTSVPPTTVGPPLATTGEFANRELMLALALLLSGLGMVAAAKLPRRQRMPASGRPRHGDRAR